MRIAYVHVLPVEYYPPATNTIAILGAHRDWEVRVWTSDNHRNIPSSSPGNAEVRRPFHPSPSAAFPLRMAGYAAWHIRTAVELAHWKPDVVLSIEPHSALAVWLYYRVLGGRARLFIHHHEYYAREDFSATGMRFLRATRHLERGALFARAEWISQTNEHRLRLMQEWNPGARRGAARVFPNYPPRDWVRRARTNRRSHRAAPTRFLYLGSASLADTFISEFAEWVASNPEAAALHVVGNNISADVWDKLLAMRAANITLDQIGWEYDTSPERLSEFDVGLILYKGNTQNFVFNIPNKAIEYLAAGLEVWYPHQMRALADFHQSQPDLRMKNVDFENLPDAVPQVSASDSSTAFPFDAETAIAPLIDAIEKQLNVKR